VVLETASLLIAIVRAVPWKEHNDEAFGNFPLVSQIGWLSGHS
jgi:quercetin dioxygenase-like cupin family protein